MNQKDAVVAAIRRNLPGVTLYKDIALMFMSSQQLEKIKEEITTGILDGTIDYGKDRTNRAEVIPYARSMVMNHLKKARELNGNQTYGSSTSNGPRITKVSDALNGIDQSILTDELKEFVQGLV